MPTVTENINVNVSTGELNASLSLQVEQLQQIVVLVQQFADKPPSDVSAFLDLAGQLPMPSFNVSGEAPEALQNIRNALPRDLSGFTAAVDGNLADFVSLIQQQLEPLLEDALKTARSVERLINQEFNCNTSNAGPGIADGGPATEAGEQEPIDGEESQSGDNPGAERLARLSGQVERVNQLMDQLPDPLTAGSLIQFLVDLTDNGKERAILRNLTLPVIDDLIEPLQTLSRWADLSPGEIASEIAATLDRIGELLEQASFGWIHDLGEALNALLDTLDLPDLASFCDQWAATAEALIAALEADDTDALNPLIAELNDTLDNIADTFTAYDQSVADNIEKLCTRLSQFADGLMGEISHLATLLEPTDWTLQLNQSLPDFTSPDEAAIAKVEAAMAPVTNWLTELVDVLDFSAVQGEVSSVANQAAALARSLEQGLETVATDVRALFDSARHQVDGVDLQQLQDDLIDEINAFGDQLETTLENAFDPASDAISQMIGELSVSLDDFNPTIITDALHSVLQSITDVLNGNEIQSAINEIRKAVNTITETLEQLSFAPVTDEVVALIEKMTEALKTLAQSDMNDAAQAALSVAMRVLPESLEPVTKPLVAEFDELIQSRPVPLLEQVMDKPQQLMSAITRFQPVDLIGDDLAEPFDHALSQMDQFRPSSLLNEAEAELDKARETLKQTASPATALAPLNQLFQEVRNELQQYGPDQVLAPLEQQVSDTINQILDASPVDEIFAQVNRVFAIIEQIFNVPRQLQNTLERVVSVLGDLENPDQQLDQWRDQLLVNFSGGGAVDDSFSQLAERIQQTTHEALLARFDTATAPLHQALENVRPAQRSITLNRLYARVSTLTASLPDSSEKTELQQALNRFDPGRAGPLHSAKQLSRCLDSARSQLVQQRLPMVDMLEAGNSVFHQLVAHPTVNDGLNNMLNQAMEPVLVPLRHLGHLLQCCRPAAESLLRQVSDLLEQVSQGLGDLLTGPDSLQAITQEVETVIDSLRNIDLSFLNESIQSVFDELLEQLDALNPESITQALEQAFNDRLDGLSLNQLIDSQTLSDLDQSYGQAVDKLRALHPQQLIIDVVQPEYDNSVAPLLSAFDLTPAFNALMEFLLSLSDELDSELARVNSAYKTLRAARPSVGDSININVSL